MTKPMPAELQQIAEKEAEAHCKEYFKRNDLPGPGSKHDQIFLASFDACYAAMSAREAVLREALEYYLSYNYLNESQDIRCVAHEALAKLDGGES